MDYNIEELMHYDDEEFEIVNKILNNKLNIDKNVFEYQIFDNIDKNNKFILKLILDDKNNDKFYKNINIFKILSSFFYLNIFATPFEINLVNNVFKNSKSYLKYILLADCNYDKYLYNNHYIKFLKKKINQIEFKYYVINYLNGYYSNNYFNVSSYYDGYKFKHFNKFRYFNKLAQKYCLIDRVCVSDINNIIYLIKSFKYSLIKKNCIFDYNNDLYKIIWIIISKIY